MTAILAQSPHVSPQNLIDALNQYAFPEGFAAKLIQETRLNPSEIAQLLQEYRRFLILAATSGQSVTPSQLVDEAWHLHLTYSRDYWERLVPLLGRPLHHEPARDEGEREHYQEQYMRTLNLYRDTFGEDAPQRWWPDPRRTTSTRLGAQNQKMTFGEFLRAVPSLFQRGSRLRRGIGILCSFGFIAMLIWGFVSGFGVVQILGGALFFAGAVTFDGFRGGESGIDLDGADGGDSGDGGDGGGSCGGGCGGGCGS